MSWSISYKGEVTEEARKNIAQQFNSAKNCVKNIPQELQQVVGAEVLVNAAIDHAFLQDAKYVSVSASGSAYSKSEWQAVGGIGCNVKVDVFPVAPSE